MTRIALLDYGMGNLHSAAKALEYVGAAVDVTNDPKLIANFLIFKRSFSMYGNRH